MWVNHYVDIRTTKTDNNNIHIYNNNILYYYYVQEYYLYNRMKTKCVIIMKTRHANGKPPCSEPI